MKNVQNSKLLNFTPKQFDIYMCTKYPDLFVERNYSVMASCMSHGFDIDKGWYPVLDELCEKIQEVCNVIGSKFVFKQIKEKYGLARFYFTNYVEINDVIYDNIDVDFWNHYIDSLVLEAENKTNHLCSCCGKRYRKTIIVNHWIYTLCRKCYNEKGRRKDE